MKRWVLIICSGLLILMLTACGGKKTENLSGDLPSQRVEAESEKPDTEVQQPVSIHSERVIAIDGMKNVRDLGGLVTTDGKMIQKGLVFRGSEMSGAYANITQQGIEKLRNTYQIQTELDLRKDTEATDNGIQVTGSKLGADVQYIHLSAKDYYDFLRGTSNEAEIMRVFADYSNYPILFHCIYGADRTGTVAFLLEALVGVSYDDLIADYELTGWRDREYSPFKILTTAYEKKLEGSDLQDKTYRVFRDVYGLTEMEISNIRNIFLTDSAVFESDSLTAPYSVSGDQVVFHLNLRNSTKVQSVEYQGQPIAFELSDNVLTFSGLTLIDGEVGTITFDDGSSLKFGIR